MPIDTRADIAELDLTALEAALVALGQPRFHARQIFQWVHRHAVSDFAAMSDLGRDLRAELARDFRIATPTMVKREQSTDGTTKFLLRLFDGKLIESVYIPDHPIDDIGTRDPRSTFCISTQVGCAMRCAFCLTGTMGIDRSLTAGEFVGQVRVLARDLGLLSSRFNIVLMGMGEPLHNYDETMKALRILSDTHGFGMPPRRITLSTVGLLPALERLAKEPVMPNLAISLHAPTDAVRDRLVPVNRKYGVTEIIAACKRFPLKKRSRITFEYVLLAGVNDSTEDERRLGRLLAGMKAKVNLIPLNAAAGIPYDRPSDEAVDLFARSLAEQGMTVSV